jgi:DNA-binding Lrp family transcriptional regulator
MVSAYVLISVEPGKNQDVVAALRQVAGVTQAHACWGQPDIFAHVDVDNDGAMADTVLVTIHAIPGVRTTETHLVAPVQKRVKADQRCSGPEGRHR